MVKKGLISAAIALAVLVLITVGLLLWCDLEFRPDSLPHPDDLPKSNSPYVGQTMKVSFSMWAKEVDGGVPFVYVYNPDTNTGRLAVSQLPNLLWPSSAVALGEDIPSVSVLTVYNPEWKGLDGLLGALSGGFFAQVENSTFISYQEGQYLLGSMAHPATYHEQYHSIEIIDPLAVPAPRGHHSGLEIYMGIVTNHVPDDKAYWTDLGNDSYVYLTGNLAATPSEAFSGRLSVFTRIVKRFSLETAMGMK